jgi:hypothetical protein
MNTEAAQALDASGESDVVKAEDAEAIAEAETVETEDGDEPEERKRKTSKERREQDKAYKLRLRMEREEAVRRADEAEKRAARILDAGKAVRPPVASDFTDPTEFIAAKAVWQNTRTLAERDAGFVAEEAQAERGKAQAIEQQERAIVAQAWQAQLASARQRYADFDAVALADEVPIFPHVADILVSSEMGADVAYHLGRNRALALEIAHMTPIEAARAIGRLERDLSRPQPKTQTSAPQPINPVRGSSSATPNPEKMTMQQYIEARRSGKLR